MKTLQIRLGKAADRSAGISLIEVIVAMFIFALISLGVASALITMTRVSTDAAARQAASSLASSTIDNARSITDLTTLVSSTSPTNITVGGRAYHVSTIAQWNQVAAGPEAQCSSGSGALISKSVRVVVTWDGMGATAAPAEAATVVSPATRVSAIDKGVILVSVRTASGAGNAGVSISVVKSPVNPGTAQTITSAIAPTDAQGCGYILNVNPGKYVVSIAKSGTSTPSVDILQSPSPSQSVDVTAGSSSTAPFQFDQSGTFTVRYGTNFTSSPVVLPSGLATTFVNNYPMYVTTLPGPYALHPWAAGYSVLAGALAVTGSTASSCLSVDPGAWPSMTDVTGTYSGKRPNPAAASPGGPVTVDVAMGVATVTGPANAYIKAVAQTAGPSGSGDPGCAMPSTYVYQLPSSGVANLALPFGSWTFTSGNATTQTTAVPASSIVIKTRGAVATVSGKAVASFDPRTLVTP